jgi:Domain of unknown function (DUF4326)
MLQLPLFDKFHSPSELRWTERELELRRCLERGETVVVNVRKIIGDRNLVHWAQERGLFVYIGHRGLYHKHPDSIWKNPYRPAEKATEEEQRREHNRVCDLYAATLARRPDLLGRIGALKGKALGCWCSPLRCHGDVLSHLANGAGWPGQNQAGCWDGRALAAGVDCWS